MKVALLQLTSSDDPAANLAVVEDMIAKAVTQGAAFICTPEVTNCVSMDRAHQRDVLTDQSNDPTLAGLRKAARVHGVWISIGSLALTGGDGGRFVNRSFLLSPTGDIVATYDKMHMFDVQISDTEHYAESSGYAPGNTAVLADAEFAKIGMTICYDLRFPHLHRDLAKAGADILLVPSAFSPVTGAAHWDPLLRARAIETGCFVIAAAQTGVHPTITGKARETYGHSVIISPWGEIMCNAGTECGITLVEINLNDVSKARRRIPALVHDVVYDGP